MGMHEPKTKTLSYKSVSSAERARFEYHPLNGGARTSNKKPFNDEGLYWRRGRDSKILPSMGAHEPQIKSPSMMKGSTGGEGGIRTREPLWVTRFPSVRAKPDYATSPFFGRADYTTRNFVDYTKNGGRFSFLNRI